MRYDFTQVAKDLADLYGLSLIQEREIAPGCYYLMVQDMKSRPLPIGFKVDTLLEAILVEAGSEESVHELIRAAAQRRKK